MKLVELPVFLVACALSLIPSTSADDVIVKRGVSDADMEGYVQELTHASRIVTALKVRLTRRSVVFDVTSANNSDARPWVIQVNVTDNDYQEKLQKYSDEGFELTVHDTIVVNRQKRHSAVWVQHPAPELNLNLPDGEYPVTGETGKDLGPLNAMMFRMLQENNIPGATLAVARGEEIIFDRGFGYRDADSLSPMVPASVLRIASLSKPITAVAVLILVEQGRLDLDAPVLGLLDQDNQNHFDTSAAAAVDPQWKLLTVRQLLQHSGGWDRQKSKDPMFQLPEISQELHLERLAGISEVVQFQLRRPLDYQPGTKYVYSNFGYCLLGRVIAAVTRQPYEVFVQENVLQPARMTQTRLGKTRFEERSSDEVKYFTQKIGRFPAVWDRAGLSSDGQFAMVAAPYGQWDLEVMDAHGGWTSTASDLVRFLQAIESADSPLLQPETRRLMLESPSFQDPDAATWYGLGWSVRRVEGHGAVNYWHTGLFAGTSALLVRRWDGMKWAVLFNVDRTRTGVPCADVIDSLVHRAVNQL